MSFRPDRPRACGAVLAATMLVLAGCGTTGAPAAPVGSKAAPAETRVQAIEAEVPITAVAGRVEIRVASAARKLMATTAQVAKIKVTLSGGSLASPLVQEVTAAALSSGRGTVAFNDVPNGTYNVTITALDATDANIGEKTTTATVTGGQTAVVDVALKLVDTHVTSTNGNVQFDLVVSDGDVVVDPIASPSPRPSSPVLSPAPSPTPTATPTPAPTPTPSPGPASFEGDLEKTWYADGTIRVRGRVRNDGKVPAEIVLEVQWQNKGFLGFGWRTVETQAVNVGTVPAGQAVRFSATSSKKIATLFGEGDVVVTITKP